jgi:putative glutamine amidotransferase
MKKVLISPHYAKQNHILRVSAIANLTNFLIAEGFLPIIITTGTEILEYGEAVTKLVNSYLDLQPDGIIFSGGASINPCFYDFSGNFKCHSQIFRDIFELELCRQAMYKNIPIMGICRGMQLINVALGGSLKYVSNETKHAAAKDGSSGHNKTMEEMNTDSLHSLKLLPKSNIFESLKEIFQENLSVNSIHFQSIDKLAESLSLDAYSEDEEVEIVSNIDKNILGFQFHPELDLKNPVYKKLFRFWLNMLG